MSAVELPDRLTFGQVQTALMRCMNVHPTEGADYRLHPDASRLVDLFGVMSYTKTQAVETCDIDARVREVLARWLS